MENMKIKIYSYYLRFLKMRILYKYIYLTNPSNTVYYETTQNFNNKLLAYLNRAFFFTEALNWCTLHKYLT